MNIVIINRWSDNFADYGKLLDHQKNNVIYVTDNGGSNYLKYVSNYQFTHYLVQDLSSEKEMTKVFNKIIKDFNKIDRVIAMSEFDIRISGFLRDKFHVVGMNENTARNFTDKLFMKENVFKSGIPIPHFVRNLNDLKALFKLKYPVVLKPRRGASSEGVSIIDNYEELLKTITSIDKENYECEEYVNGDIYHIDGFTENGIVKFARACKYINTCYDYKNGIPVGSIMINNKSFNTKVKVFAQQVMTALGLNFGVFHLEAILSPQKGLVFLEVGARQGGGEIVPMYRKLLGLDLVKILFRSQMITLPLQPGDIKQNDFKVNSIGGFLLFPEPKNVPSVVLKKKEIRNKETMVYQICPNVGDVLLGDGGYYFNAGRFLFIGSPLQVEKDLEDTLHEYEIKTKKVSI